MHKESFIINRNTLLHISTLLGHLQGELFVIVTLRLHFIVEWQCAVDCVLCSGGVNSLRSGLHCCSAGRDRTESDKTLFVHLLVISVFVQIYVSPVISGFRSDIVEICTLLGCYVTSNGKPLPTFRANVSVLFSSVKKSPWPLMPSPTRWPDTSVKDV
jgi:hypothetical protein